MHPRAFKPRDQASHPPYIHPSYKSTVLRGPTKPLVPLPHTLSELTGPVYGHESVGPLDADLTRNAAKNGAPLGERIIVTGRVVDEDGRPVPSTLIEIWQANAAGRYIDRIDQHDAPLDPNFLGAGRCVSDDEGRFRFYTIKPGAYPWGNHTNAWRPNHIHFRGCAGAHDRSVLDRRDRAWLCLGLCVRHRAARPPSDPDGGMSDGATTDPVPGGRALVRLRPDCAPVRLSCHRHRTPGGAVYRLDIHMQGDAKTVFFDVLGDDAPMP